MREKIFLTAYFILMVIFKAKWFNPRENQYSGISGILKNKSTYKFVPPFETDEDWVVLMQYK